MIDGSSSRPPRVLIPDRVLRSGHLSTFMATLALKHGPIFTFVPERGPLTGRDVVYLVGPEANRFVLLTHRQHFSHDLGWSPVLGWAVGKGLVNMDPPEHGQDRALMSPLFTPSFTEHYLPVMQRIIGARIRDWALREQVDLTVEMREIAFDVAAATLLGVEDRSEIDFMRERFCALLREPTAVVEGSENATRHAQIREELDKRLLELIAAHRPTVPGEAPCTVLDLLVRAQRQHCGQMSDEQLLGHLNILLIAGHETTTNLGAWVLYLLAAHPKYGARVDRELAEVPVDGDESIPSEAFRALPVLTNAIRETGRLHPPVMFLPRGVIAMFEFGGYAVPVGTPVFLAVAAGQRLSTCFTDPDEFDPDRFLPPREEDKRHPYAVVTFGGGPRTCLGINLAYLEIKALVAHVRRRYRLTPVPGRDIMEVAGIVESVPEGVHIRVRASGQF